jgi:hypothetical protein
MAHIAAKGGTLLPVLNSAEPVRDSALHFLPVAVFLAAKVHAQRPTQACSEGQPC